MNNKIGALWLKKSNSGIVFMSGEITLDDEKHQIVVFKNEHKKKDNHPDYNILKSAPYKKQGKEELEEQIETKKVDDIEDINSAFQIASEEAKKND